MSPVAGIDQLRTLDPETILTDSVETLWIEQSTGFLRARITENLVDPHDGHLGYTQLVRLAEMARYIYWRSFVATTGLDHIQDCTVVALHGSFMRPIRAGQHIELRVQELGRGTTSLRLQIDLFDISLLTVTAEFQLTLVALDRSGNKVAFELKRDKAE